MYVLCVMFLHCQCHNQNHANKVVDDVAHYCNIDMMNLDNDFEKIILYNQTIRKFKQFYVVI